MLVLVKTSELNGRALDWAVAQCEGEPYNPKSGVNGIGMEYSATCYSTDWALGGQIIERELIATEPKWHNAGPDSPTGYWYWEAYILGPNNIDDNHEQSGPTMLIAAMRCYVASKIGRDVNIPEDIL